jgi:signal transduction histidine kinase
MYLVYGICLTFWIILFIKNFRTIKSKKYAPVFAFILLMTTVALIQMANPTMLLVSSAQVFVTVLMYFTIENPDVKMVNKVNKANESLDIANQTIKQQMAELEESQDLLVKQAQMVTFGELAAGMAHDINTPISTIKNGMFGLKGHINENEYTNKLVEHMNISIEKIISITKSMRNQIRNLGTKVNEEFIVSDVLEMSKLSLQPHLCMLIVN